MIELKLISKAAISAALAKAERYRLLNEPREAESICRDILCVAPKHQDSVVTLLLALTDQFGRESDVDILEARQVLASLEGDYEQAYYAGVIYERWGKAQLARGSPPYTAIGWFQEAMGWFEQAERLSPAGNNDAILRWNACARTIMRHERADAEPREVGSDFDAGDEVPLR